MSELSSLPGRKRLLITWATLMSLTVISMVSALAGRGDEWRPLPLWMGALVLAATAFKAQQVVMVYLNLRVSSGGWKGGIFSVLLLTLTLIGAAYLAGRLLHGA